MTKTLSVLATLVVITLAMGVFSSSSFVSAQAPHCPSKTVTVNGAEVEIDSFTKSKTKKGTTITLMRTIDEDSSKFEDAMDSGKVTEMTIMVCARSTDPETGQQIETWLTVELTGIEIESIDQDVNDDNAPGKETITIKAKKSKTTFVNHGPIGSD